MTGTQMPEKRFQYLRALHDETKGDRHAHVSMWELGTQLGFDRQTTKLVCQFLEGEDLLDYLAMGGVIGITHYGVREVEEALSQPAEATQYFPPTDQMAPSQTITIHGSVYGSSFQQAGEGSVQEAQITVEQRKDLDRFIEQLTNAIDGLGLSDPNKSDLQAELGTVEAQLKASKPKHSLIQSCLMSIQRILEGTVAGAAGNTLFDQLNALLGG